MMYHQRNADLLAALSLLREEGWIQHAPKGPGGHCASGAVKEVLLRVDPTWRIEIHSSTRMRYFDALEALHDAIPGQSTNIRVAPAINIVDYNDDPRRTFAEVEWWFHAATNQKG